MADANVLQVRIVVDASQLTSGMSEAAATVEAATARIKTAFASVGSASGAFGKIRTATDQASAGVNSMDRAMAMASGRIAGFASGTGMLGGALGRVAAASSTLAPILAAAFPVLIAGAFVDIIGSAIDRFEKWKHLGEETTFKMNDLSLSVARQADALELEDVKLGNVLTKLNGGIENKLAEALLESKIKAEELGKAISDDLQKTQALLSEGPGLWQHLVLDKVNLSALGDQLKPIEFAYQMALKDNNAQGQKNALLQEQVRLQNSLDEELKRKADYDADQAKPKSELEAGGALAGGGVPKPDYDALNTLAAALSSVEDQIRQIDELPDLQNKLKGVAAAEQSKEAVEKAITLGRAQLEAEKNLQDALIEQDLVAAKEKYSEQEITEEQLYQAEVTAANKKFAVQENYQRQLLALLQKDPTKNSAQIVTAQAEIETLTVQHNKELLDLKTQYNNEVRQKAEEAERIEGEIATSSQAMAKKDLAEAEHDKAEKIRLAEEAAKAQIGASQRIAAAKEGHEEKFGALGDVAAAHTAGAALTQEQTLLDGLIQKEKDFQASLKGVPPEIANPLIDQSLQRQQQLTDMNTQAVARYRAELQKLQEKGVQSIMSITNSLNSNVISWINGQESFGRAMQKTWTSMVDMVISSLMKMLEQQLATWLMQKVLGLSISTTSATQQIQAASGVAYANAFASTSAIPIVGPELAPGVAAASAAAAMAGGLAFVAEKGGIIPGFGAIPGLLHGQEMVLPAHISKWVQQAAAGGDASGAGTGAAQSSENHIHLHYSPTIQGNADPAMLKNSARDLVKHATRELRKLNLR